MRSQAAARRVTIADVARHAGVSTAACGRDKVARRAEPLVWWIVRLRDTAKIVIGDCQPVALPVRTCNRLPRRLWDRSVRATRRPESSAVPPAHLPERLGRW